MTSTMALTLKSLCLTVALGAAIGSAASAQSNQMVAIPVPAQHDAIVLGTGRLPGATAEESWYRQYDRSFAHNVTMATLTPFLPDPARATGTAVIVAPGGGFRSLSMENEGFDVAKALAARGVAAFVLKYRLKQTPADLPAFAQSMAAMFSGAAPPVGAHAAPPRAEDLSAQLADSRAAFALIRNRAAEWRINPDQIGMIGFSAGAMLTLQTALHAADTRPAFIGIIYGPLQPVAVPSNAPPMFVALAADDPLFAGQGMGLIDSWTSARRPVEFHLYEQGGHGFGMYPKTTTSTGWFNNFVGWLTMHGWVKNG